MSEIKTDQFTFYVRWLLLVGVIMALFGIGLAVFKNTLLSFLVNDLFSHTFWPNTITDEGTARFKDLILSLCGAMMATWGILLFGIINNAFKKRELWAWNTVFISTCVWFTIDEFFSVYYHVWLNAVGNIPFLIMLIVPLVMTRKFMVKGEVSNA
jgi:hypothetical protein